ncbi:unnamed protein product, partial [marine sediment metagenome]
LLINFVDMDRIIHAVETTSVFTEERIQEFSSTYNIIFKRDVNMDDKNRKFREFLNRESQGRGRAYQKGYSQNNKYQGRGRGRGQRQGYSGKSQGSQVRQAPKVRHENKSQSIPPLPNFPQKQAIQVKRFEL